jgi:hypothetical protein
MICMLEFATSDQAAGELWFLFTGGIETPQLE